MPTSKHPKVPLPVNSHRNQCPTCGLLFGGFRTFDLHRVGPFNDPSNPRRCLTEAEMAKKGILRGKDGAYGRSIDADRLSRLREAR